MSEVRNKRPLGAAKVHRIDPVRSGSKHQNGQEHAAAEDGHDHSEHDNQTGRDTDDDAAIDEYV